MADEKNQEKPKKKKKGKKKKGGKKKVKKPAKPKKPPLWTRVKPFVVSAKDVPIELIKALFSSDGPTRRMALLFFVSCAGLVFIVGLATQKFLEMREQAALGPDAGQVTGEFFAKQKAAAEIAKSHFNMGKFTFELAPTDKSLPSGVLNVAEVVIEIHCDEVETCEYIKKHITPARDVVSSVLIAIDRDELMSKDGKVRLMAKVMDRLNKWLRQGKVMHAFVTKLIIG